jgi:hypothetical protein
VVYYIPYYSADTSSVKMNGLSIRAFQGFHLLVSCTPLRSNKRDGHDDTGIQALTTIPDPRCCCSRHYPRLSLLAIVLRAAVYPPQTGVERGGLRAISGIGTGYTYAW